MRVAVRIPRSIFSAQPLPWDAPTYETVEVEDYPPQPLTPYGDLSTFQFLGWEFGEKHPAFLVSYHKLSNPEPPGAIYAYHGFRLGILPFSPFGREWAAAWIISHWWEHKLKVCDCLTGDRDNNFRRAFIETVLDMEQARAKMTP